MNLKCEALCGKCEECRTLAGVLCLVRDQAWVEDNLNGFAENTDPPQSYAFAALNDPKQLAILIVRWIKSRGIEAECGSAGTVLNDSPWLVLTPYGNGCDGGISVYYETGTQEAGDRRGTCRNIKMKKARKFFTDGLSIRGTISGYLEVSLRGDS